MIGAAWQRCRVHFLRNVLAQVPKGSQEMVAAAVRTIFAQPDAEHVREQHHRVRRLPGLTLKKIWSTNPPERVNKEIKRGTDVKGVFPNPPPCSGSPAAF
jgi:putative transposase